MTTVGTPLNEIFEGSPVSAFSSSGGPATCENALKACGLEVAPQVQMAPAPKPVQDNGPADLILNGRSGPSTPRLG